MSEEKLSNSDRAFRVIGAISKYCRALHGGEFKNKEVEISDMLGDLMHFCDFNGLNFDDALSMAKACYRAESRIMEKELREAWTESGALPEAQDMAMALTGIQ